MDEAKKGPYPVIVTAAVIRDGDKVLLARRSGGHLSGKWEFPGGKLEPGESPEECLARELGEELGIEAGVGDIFTVIHHQGPAGPLLLLFYFAAITGGSPQPLDCGDVRWVPVGELDSCDLAPADRLAASRLARSACGR